MNIKSDAIQDNTGPKRNVLFVGSFNYDSDSGGTGGQMFACQSLLNSRLSENINWILIDSTAELPLRPVPIRSLYAMRRVATLVYHLITKDIDTAIVFSAHGVSFLEKGLMVLIMRIPRVRTLFAPRSGFIIEDIASPIKRKYIQWVFQCASVVICQSPYWQSEFNKVAPHGNYKIIHNWIDSSVNHHSDKQYGEKNPTRLLFLGWITHSKGIFDLIEATWQLAQTFDIKLEVAGDGDAMEELKRLVDERNLQHIVNIRGWVNPKQKQELFKICDIFIQPTHAEGFPNSVLEAMNAGVPVVCTDIPAISSLVNHHEDCILFKRENVNDLASSIQELLESPELRLKLAAGAKQLISEKFDIDYGVTAFEEIV